MANFRNLKIAFVHPDLGIGGAERLVLDVALALTDQGAQIQFLTNHFDKSHAFEELKTNKYRVSVIGDWLPRSIFGIFHALCSYVRMLYLPILYCFFIRHVEPDLYFVDQIPTAVPILKWYGGKVIYYCHHPDLLASPQGGVLKKLYRWPIDWFEQYGTSKADLILVNSEYTASVFRNTFPKIQQELRILYPTISSSLLVDINKVERIPVNKIVPEMQHIKPTDFIFLSINRYHPAKKIELAIDAMDKLRHFLSDSEWNRLYLVIAGGYDGLSHINSSYFKILNELARFQDLITKVVFLKSPSDKLKALLLKSCDCLVYTSTDEHFGIVPLEAMAAAKPVIACDSGGPRETVVHEVTGYLCEPSPDSLAFYMAKCLDKARAEEYGMNGLKRLERMFSQGSFSTNCVDIVNKVCVKK